MLQHLGLHHRIEQHLVGALHGCQHVHALHQVGHTHVVVALRLLLACLQQLLVQQVVGMIGLEHDVVGVVRIGVNPYRVFPSLEHATQYGSKRTRS